MNKQTSLLRGACLLGLVVFLVLLGTLVFISLHGGISFFLPVRFARSSFTEAMEEYDQKILDNPSLSFKQHNSLLDGLEKKAVDTENILSVLKRRRYQALHAAEDREQYLNSHIEAAARVRKQFPHSPQIGAVAAEALILKGFTGKGETAAEIQELASLMSEGALSNLALVFSIYSGAMGDPAQALNIRKELFTLLCSMAKGEEREKYLVNACIRTILDNNSLEAGPASPASLTSLTSPAYAMVNALFTEPPIRDETIIFGAEFFYDYGNYLRSAELFSAFSDSRSLARQADAQWLAGFADSARGLWRMAAADTRSTANKSLSTDIDIPSIKARSFYNLASTASDPREAGRYLEQLFAANAEYKSAQTYGIIRYSRLVPADRAIAILSEADPEKEGLFDLELLRRRSEQWDVNKSVTETWMLLNRHSKDGRLFEWAVWYFDFQRRYEETALALRNAGINRVEGPWSALHRAFGLIREHNFAEAEKTLRSIVRSPQETKSAPGRRTQPLWQAGAGLAMLLEKQNNLQEALQYYEIASGQLIGLIARQSALNEWALDERLPIEPGDPSGEPLAGTPPVNRPSATEPSASRPSASRPFDSKPGIPAAGVSLERRDAAKIQVRIANVLRTLGKIPECVRALDYALDLDPENLEARLEKRRINAERGIL